MQEEWQEEDIQGLSVDVCVPLHQSSLMHAVPPNYTAPHSLLFQPAEQGLKEKERTLQRMLHSACNHFPIRHWQWQPRSPEKDLCGKV